MSNQTDESINEEEVPTSTELELEQGIFNLVITLWNTHKEKMGSQEASKLMVSFLNSVKSAFEDDKNTIQKG